MAIGAVWCQKTAVYARWTFANSIFPFAQRYSCQLRWNKKQKLCSNSAERCKKLTAQLDSRLLIIKFNWILRALDRAKSEATTEKKVRNRKNLSNFANIMARESTEMTRSDSITPWMSWILMKLAWHRWDSPFSAATERWRDSNHEKNLFSAAFHNSTRRRKLSRREIFRSQIYWINNHKASLQGSAVGEEGNERNLASHL